MTSLLSIAHEEIPIGTLKTHVVDSESSKSTPLLEEYDHFDYEHQHLQQSKPQPKRIYREVIFVTIAVFMGYASLVVVQKKLYDQYQSNNGGHLSHSETEIFEHGTSLVYFGNLCFRLLHNVVFAKITPRYRVVLSLILISTSMCILVIMYFIALSPWIGWVYIAYLLGGVSIGSFESNLLSTITPLGPDTKIWAIIGMPVGFTCISVVGYAVMGVFKITVAWLYITTAIMGILAVALWLMRIPVPESYNQQDFAQFVSNLKSWKLWLPKIIGYALSLTVDMFMVSFFSAINQYILDGDKLPIFGSGNQHVLMDTNDFFSVYSIATFIGDTMGRKIIYYFNLSWIHPRWYLVLSLSGALCCILKIPLLTWMGMFAIFLANGLIYAASTKFIDKNVSKRFSLTAISFWLFIGDIGSLTGSNLWQLFQPIVCSKNNNSVYFCVKE